MSTQRIAGYDAGMENGKRLNTVEEIVAFAIERERQAQTLYRDYARRTDRQGFGQLLLSMAGMEQEHERKLREAQRGGRIASSFAPGPAEDLKLDQFLVDVPFSPDMEYGDFLILVIKKEGQAEALYRGLAAAAQVEDLRGLFSLLAGEEAKHKSWVQDRYDLEILKEN